MHGHVSPRLGWRFENRNGDIAIIGPDGRILKKPDEIAAERDELAVERDQAAAKRDEAARRAERLAAKLRELGVDPDQV